jgi:hypothetical protein
MTTTDQSSTVSFGAYIVDLFKVDTDQFKLAAKTVHPDPTYDEHLSRKLLLEKTNSAIAP